MTLPQALSLSIIAAMMVLFVWGRLRYDLVALLALAACVLSGVVPANKAFTGFSDDVVIIVATALVVSAGVAKSGVMETLLRPLAPHLTSTRAQVFVLVVSVIALSTFVKNVGALAILMPVAFQMAKRTGTQVSQLLMPLSFGSLIGGLITLVGTSPNVIVSRLRADIVGQPFEMFDFAPVGIVVAGAGLLCLLATYRLLPNRTGGASLETAINIENYVIEAKVGEGSGAVGQRAVDVVALGEGAVRLTTIVRERFRRLKPTPMLRLQAGDVLLLEGDPEVLERLVARSGLVLGGQGKEGKAVGDAEEIGIIEGVVMVDSALIGETSAELRLRERFEVNLIAVSRAGEHISRRLRSVRFQAGDVVLLQGQVGALPEALKALGVLPLAERSLGLGRDRRRWIPVAVLAVSVLAIALNLVPVAAAFFLASVALLLTGALSLREAYHAIEPPILVLLAALIPVSEAVQTTGATELIAGWLSVVARAVPAYAALTLILVSAMAVTPFLNNAATVLVMAPIGAALAKQLGLSPDPFLMAVAIGAACDFLTPFGHQCNTLVMGPGGYRFGDYWKLGLPLSITVIAVAVPAIAVFWPLAAR